MTTAYAEKKEARDLTHGISAWLLWCLPITLLVVSGAWHRGMAWVWMVAFAVMSAGCLANAVRCRRTHCYVTGPLFLLAAIWSLLAALGLVPLHANFLSLAVIGIVLLAYVAEIPLGRYRQARP